VKANNNSLEHIAQPPQMGGGQLSIVADGCKVKINFPEKSENSALNDIKQMMAGGVVIK